MGIPHSDTYGCPVSKPTQEPAHAWGNHPRLWPEKKFRLHHFLLKHPWQPWVCPPSFLLFLANTPSSSLTSAGFPQPPANRHFMSSWSYPGILKRYPVKWSAVGLGGPSHAWPHILWQHPTPFPIFPLESLGSDGVVAIQGHPRY